MSKALLSNAAVPGLINTTLSICQMLQMQSIIHSPSVPEGMTKALHSTCPRFPPCHIRSMSTSFPTLAKQP